MPSYRIDIPVWATLYVTASTKEEAERIIVATTGSEVEISGGDIAIDGEDAEIADGAAALSPAATVAGVDEIKRVLADIEEIAS